MTNVNLSACLNSLWSHNSLWWLLSIVWQLIKSDGNLLQCAQVGFPKGAPRSFFSLPLAHKLDWVRYQVRASNVWDFWELRLLLSYRLHRLELSHYQKQPERQEDRDSGTQMTSLESLYICVCVHTCVHTHASWVESEDKWVLVLTFYLTWGIFVFPLAILGQLTHELQLVDSPGDLLSLGRVMLRL